LESELFGHEKGAFTGAAGIKHGLIEAAHTGTLFADEIGALEPEIQASFLRLMETQEYRRVGGTQTRKADVRIVAATNADLAGAVREGKFRDDLFFRLSVIVLQVPPLRQRKEDIPLLAEYFLGKAQFREKPKRFSETAIQELVQHEWPGNVRELKNTIERAALLSDGDTIEVWDLRILSSHTDRIVRRLVPEEDLVPLGKLQSRYIHLVLEKVGGNQQRAAGILGIDPKTIYRHLRKK
jgi:transcriptional regulator with PAS, ATPase and Fis domain